VLLQTELTLAGETKIPVTTSSSEARGLFLKGRELVDNLRLTDAHPYFRKALALDSGFALANLYLAQTAGTAKEFFADLEKAASHADKVTEAERLWIFGVRSGAYGEITKQRENFSRLVKLYPGDERAHMLLGISHFGVQEYDEAAKLLQRATEISPTFAPAYNQLGYAYRFLGRTEKAETVFRKYTELIPDDPNPYDSYAELLLKIGRFTDAIAQYEKALAVNDHFANSYAGIASALIYQGKHAEALVTLDKALSLARNDGEKRAALFSRAVVFADRGDLTLAMKEMEKQYALGKQTGDVAAMAGDLVFMGNILKNFDRANAMIQESKLATAVKANNAMLHAYNTARAAIAGHDLATARTQAGRFREGVALKKNQNQTRLVHELDGMIALEEKRYDDAVTELQQANLQNPYNLYRLALAHESRGDTGAAATTLEQAARFNSLPALNYAFIRGKAEEKLTRM
jgi:tetratricopeptide (TPR) repeat protein